MKVSDVTTEKRATVKSVVSLNIQGWDRRNDYPQKLWDAIAESGTALSCLEVYASFVRGAGFPSAVADSIMNRKGQNLNDLLALTAEDRARFGGFAIHVNYNEFYEAAEFNYIPFEHTRLGLPTIENPSEVTTIAINSDWTGATTRPTLKNTAQIPIFNPDKVVIAAQVKEAGGDIKNYKGQVLWWSNAYGFNYPVPICDAIITDINTEGGVATVKNRNAKNNFFGAGIFIVEGETTDNPDNTKVDNDENEESNLVTQIKKMQGDRNSCNVAVLELDRGAREPKHIPFAGENYDGAFKETEVSIQKNIGRRFKQPPVLRCEDVSSGFAENVMSEAYHFYNTVTQDERAELERVFTRLLAAYTNYTDLSQFKIIPKSYGNSTNQ